MLQGFANMFKHLRNLRQVQCNHAGCVEQGCCKAATAWMRTATMQQPSADCAPLK